MGGTDDGHVKAQNLLSGLGHSLYIQPAYSTYFKYCQVPAVSPFQSLDSLNSPEGVGEEDFANLTAPWCEDTVTILAPCQSFSVTFC